MSAEVLAFAGLVLGLVVAAVVALAVWIVRAVRHELRLRRRRGALVDRFIGWAVARAERRLDGAQRVVTFDGDLLFTRHAFAWRDEFVSASGKHWSRPPWWRPFNVLLHQWPPGRPPESFHDHPRWSVTVCLKGQIVERTPWGDRLLTPGKIVVRSRKAIHAFGEAPGHAGETWTLFVVGRRNHWQNTYVVTSRAPKADADA